MQSRGRAHCASGRNGQAPRAPNAQRDLKLARRHVLGFLPALVAVPAAKADEGSVTLISEKENLSGYQAQVLEYNLRIQRQNSAPAGFPSFIRDKFDIAVIAEGYQLSPEGVELCPLILTTPTIVNIHMIGEDCAETTAGYSRPLFHASIPVQPPADGEHNMQG